MKRSDRFLLSVKLLRDNVESPPSQVVENPTAKEFFGWLRRQ